MTAPRNRWRKRLALAAWLSLLWLAPAWGTDVDDRHALVSVKVFAAMLAADLDIGAKVAADGRLHLLLVHDGESDLVTELAERLRLVRAVRGLPLVVSTVAAGELARYRGPPPAGVFIAAALPRLGDAAAVARRGHAVLFSPIPGDLDHGAHGSVHVSDRILPLIDRSALAAAGIRLKPFFLEVAKSHGD